MAVCKGTECELRRRVCFCYINGSDSGFLLRRESTYRILLSGMVSRSNSYKGLLIESVRWLLSEIEHGLNIWMFPI